MGFSNLRTSRIVDALLASVVLLGAAGPASAFDRYFVLIFSSQTTPKLPRFSHVWATAVKLSNAELPPTSWTFQVDTISWVPANLVVRPLKLRSEPGANLTLGETLRFVASQNQHVSVWGPLEIPPLSYQGFIRQKARLESGQVRYKCIDTVEGTKNVSDCIHSLTDMDPYHGRSAYPLSRFGNDAADYIVKVLKERGRILAEGPCVEFVYEALGLQGQRIARHSAKSASSHLSNHRN